MLTNLTKLFFPSLFHENAGRYTQLALLYKILM